MRTRLRESKWELMAANVTQRCRSALPGDSPPDQTGHLEGARSPSWGGANRPHGQDELLQPPGLPQSRGTAPRRCQQEHPMGRQPLRCGSSGRVSLILFSGTGLFQKRLHCSLSLLALTPRQAAAAGRAVGTGRRGMRRPRFVGCKRAQWLRGENGPGRGLRLGVCSQPPMGAVQSPIDRDSTGANLRRLRWHDLEADARRTAWSRGRSPLWGTWQRGTGSRCSPCPHHAALARGHRAAQAGTHGARGDLPAWAGGTSGHSTPV